MPRNDLSRRKGLGEDEQVESAAHVKAASAAVVTAMAEGRGHARRSSRRHGRVAVTQANHRDSRSGSPDRYTGVEGEMRNLSSRVDWLEGERGPPDDNCTCEESQKLLKKMQGLVDQVTEADGDMSPEDYERKLSVVIRTAVMRAAWKARFLGANWETEMSEYLERRQTAPDAEPLNWRFNRYMGLDE